MRVLVVLFAILVGGCSLIDDPRPQAPVTIYGQNDRAEDAWFGLVPLTDPPQTVGFGADSGVACLVGPVGTEIAWFDGSPGQGGQPVRAIGTVRPADGPPNVLWVSVAVDGTLTTGEGVPGWWVGDAQAC